ncbi:MAG: hypothetical protein LUI60_02995 [Clostridia bacterium]|nr:hypothetical protein [Clostridia bacterium]
MFYTIENEYLKLTVTDEGGTMCSLVYKPTGEERLWQGQEFWKSRDVVIFPIIGHAAPYQVSGTTYELKSHGVVRYATLSAQAEENKITLSLSSTEQTLKVYPYEFDFSVSYTLDKNTLKVTYFVKSKGGKMPFYVGGHPGMSAPGGSAVIEFENTEHPVMYPIDSATAVTLPELKRFVADKAFFKECKTLQLGSLSGGAINMYTQDGYTYTYKSACPLFAFWSNEEGGDYVCVEPWWGINDLPSFPREITLKPFINFDGGDSREFFYTLTINKD